MAISYINILTFLLTTLFYYFTLKPFLTYTQASNPEEYTKYINQNNVYLAIYFVSVMIIQFIANIYIVTSTCGGNITDNLEAAGTYTFISWSLIFGVLVIILRIYPGFKSVFSDIFGYYFISSSADALLTDLLVDKNIPVTSDSIKILLGNSDEFINKMVPENFNQMWNLLTPLIKVQPTGGEPITDNIKQSLFDLIVIKDNIGEASWVLYTGILVIFVVQLQLITRGCVQNASTMVKNYKKYLEEDDKMETKNKQSTDMIYTLNK
jgi:hypothetical protein